MNDDFTETIINFIENTTENVSELRINVQKELVAGVTSDTPRKTGLAVRNWQAARDSIPTGIIPYAGDPETAESIATFAAQATAFGEDGVWYFVNNVHYIYYLEFGTSKMAARGMARKNSQRIADNLRSRYG